MSLKDQLAKLGMIEDSESRQDQRTPSSWGSEREASGQKKSSGRDRKQRGRDPRDHKSRGGNRSGGERRSSPPTQLDLPPEEREKRIKDLLGRARLPLPPHGRQRFYFELKGGVIDFIDTNQGSYDALTSGQVVIVADEQGRPIGIDRQAAQELRRLDLNWIPARL